MTTKIFKVTDQRVNEGGLMRCCLLTLHGWLETWLQENRVVEVNTTVECLYAHDNPDHKMILDSTGTWRWFRKET